VAPYAEDYLEPPEGRLKTQIPDVPGPEDSPDSTMGAGAILLEGREDTEGQEGPGMGQSADTGEAGEQEDSPELTRPGRVPGHQEPSPGGDEEMQALTEDKPLAGPDARAEQQRAGGGLPGDAPPGTGGDEGAGQTGESLASEERPLESTVEPMRAQQEGDSDLGVRQGLEEELQQAMAQWLARIPDEPAGLLREKFLRAYRRNPTKPAGLDPW
jgi:Ca-activated chloride channel family protein